jgi:HYR domain
VLFILLLAPLALALNASAGSVTANITLLGEFRVAECTEGGATARCFIVEESGPWPGLGQVEVHETVVQSGLMDEDLCEPQTRHGVFTTNRGTISYVATGIDCPGTRNLLGGYRGVIADWVVTGGTGLYEGATGDGTQNVRPEDDGDEVNTHYVGSVSVPGVEFDTAAPVLRGVPRRLTVRSARPAIVKYTTPTAVDAVDGAVAVTCLPRSGARFRIGRTVVRCAATDSSANERAATFVVAVQKSRV